MKLAVVGKGGSGKTTTSAVVARALARRGHAVVALDCDTNSNLGISLGVGDEETGRLVSLRESLDAGEEEHAPEATDLLERFGTDAPDGVRLAVVQLLGSIESDGRTVIADFEAGVGTLTRMKDGSVDVVLVVVEPTPKSLEVGRRAVGLARERGLARLVIVANRVRDDADYEVVAAAFPGEEVVRVPDDPNIVAADRAGVAPLDLAPDAPAVQALVELAGRVAPAG
jgi:CO dehydrogenase maturation factor